MNYESFNNNVLLVGSVVNDISFSHVYSYTNKIFYKFNISVKRSGKTADVDTTDIFPIVVSSDQIDQAQINKNKIVSGAIVLVRGAIRTTPSSSVIARKITIVDDMPDTRHNIVDLTGCVFGDAKIGKEHDDLIFFDLSMLRKAGDNIKEEKIPIVARVKTIDLNIVSHGKMIDIVGALRYRNKNEHDIVSVFAHKIEEHTNKPQD